MADLLEQLKAALADRYAIERSYREDSGNSIFIVRRQSDGSWLDRPLDCQR